MKDFKKYFIKAIVGNYPDHSEDIIAKTENHLHNIAVDVEFARTSKNPIDKRLEFCAYFLALIKSLEKQGETFESIRRVCLEVVTEYVRPKNKFQAMLKRLPPKLLGSRLAKILLKVLNRKTSRRSHPEGFVANILTEKPETLGFGYGVDILECGICKLYMKHGYFKYATILCEVDAMTSNLAGLKLIRTGTIANGASKCDFRFIKED